ncbi:MAG: hypothetical protein AAFV53_23250 [Myxococcota bacterium]
MSGVLLDSIGRRNWNAGELITNTGLSNIGVGALQAVLHLFGRMLLGSDGTPRSGFFGDDCLASKGVGELDYTIAPGLGFYHDASVSGDWDISYLPISIDAAVSGTLIGHDPTNPRIDLICLRPREVIANTEIIAVKDAGVATTQNATTKRRYSHEVLVVQGIAALNPVAPAALSDAITIARVAVPGGSGPIVVTDTRPVLAIGPDWAPDVHRDLHANAVVGQWFTLGTSLQVSALGSGGGLNVRVAAGEATIRGQRYRYEASTVALAAADLVNGRIDVIVARADGIAVITGPAIPTPSPDWPNVEAENEVVLAQVLVNAGVSDIFSAQITDERQQGYLYGRNHIADRTIRYRQMASPVLGVVLSLNSILTNIRTLNVDLKSPDNNAIKHVGLLGAGDPFPVRCLARLYDNNLEPANSADVGLDVTLGSAVSATGGAGLVFNTTSDGQAILSVTRSGSAVTGTFWVKVEPAEANPVGGHGFSGLFNVSFS